MQVKKLNRFSELSLMKNNEIDSIFYIESEHTLKNHSHLMSVIGQGVVGLSPLAEIHYSLSLRER